MSKRKKPNRIVEEMQQCNAHFATDPNGSYTGKCENPYETPVQDADDL